ncbi:interaptin-like isoform X3 [Asparagus officinalis]|uniref:interaptin-like isoform X2 n=1 Tax=Asparagus officinalis TaxID=4686 RepID=UPI00098E5F7A|nr:interaptin-like isoform X2 [Asparagus officinalis]XP_020260890.1 interaptin-like isoform X3 [Asparagus officinalis]
MFKLHRHRSERLGERVEFRFSSLQAFQIPKGWDRLVLSIISAETGKTTAKSSKATVRSGTCQWTEIFSESICIPQNGGSKDIEDCVFKVVVSMGSHRSGILGELTINLTDYMSSRDSGSLSLPLKKCNYGTILQIRIQCLNPKRGFRDVSRVKETTYHLQGLHTDNDAVQSKSDGSDMLNKSLGSLAPEEPIQQDTSFSASGSHRSSDSGDSSIGRLNFSPRNNVNGGSYMGRQDSADSHISAASSVGPADEFSRSNPSSFNSRASGSSTPNRWQSDLAPISLNPSGSSKELLEAAEETIEELQDEAKMWERHAQKLKLDIEKLKKECSEKSKRQAELDIELSAAYSERDSLKHEVKQLKSSLDDVTTKQSSAILSKNEVTLRVQKELEDEVKFLKESNASLSIQLKKSQEANLELVAILEELEETVEKQRLEMANLPQQSLGSGHDGENWSKKLMDVEAEWAAKLSSKEEEIRVLEEKLSGLLIAECPNEMEWSRGDPDLIKEIDDLRGKLQELERDCAELTEENLELIFKLKEFGKGIKGENYPNNSDSEIDSLKSQVHMLEEELRTKEMLNGGLTESTKIQMRSLEKKCADLEVELQNFKDQACHLDIKLRESQWEVKGKISELSEMQQKFESFQHKDNNTGNESNLEDLISLKEKEIDELRHDKEELEVLITNIQQDRSQLEENLASALRESSITSQCFEDVQHEMKLLASSVDSHNSTNKMLERKAMELESSKNELEKQVSELEEENVQLSERISGLEPQLKYLTDELEDSRCIVEDLKAEVAKLQGEIGTREGELNQKLQDVQKGLSEKEEETEHLKRLHLKLQSTLDSLTEENTSLQKSNGDLQKQKLDLHERGARLEVELNKSQEKTSEFLETVEHLELKLSLMQNDVVSKEKTLTSQLESIFEDRENQEEKISQAKIMLNQIDSQKTVELETLKGEISHLSSQLCATQDERQMMASDAVLEVSGLRSDKIKLESSLQEALAKIKQYETELQSLKQESGKKLQGLVDLLNASKQSEETLMSDIEHIQRQAEAAKSGEEKFKKVAIELELKLKASDYEKQQIMEEISSLKVQVQKVSHLQDEILVLKSFLEESKSEKGKLEGLLRSVSEECEGLKMEKISFMEKISNMQKALIALEEKLLRLEGKLSAKEATEVHVEELKHEINYMKEENSEYQRKIQCLEEEKSELVIKVKVMEDELYQDKMALDKGEEKLHDLEATIRDLEAKVKSLENELTESMETNNMYKIQLQGLMSEKQSNNSKAPKIVSMEAELKEMKERFLHMSLQYAEVEAQRQELVLKLKTTTAKGKTWFS